MQTVMAPAKLAGPMMRAATVLLGLANLLLAGCFGDGTPLPNQETRDEWRSQAEAHGPMGIPATFDLQGDPLFLYGQGTVTNLAAPFAFNPRPHFSDRTPYLFFPDASVHGHANGLLVLEGAHVLAEEGSLSDAGLESVNAAEEVELKLRADNVASKPSYAFPPGWEAAQDAFFFDDMVPARVAGLELSGFERALLVTASTNEDLSQESAVTVTASRLVWDSASSIRGAGAQLRLDTFALGGSVETGSLLPQGRDAVDRPAGVFGRDATISVAAGHLSTANTFRLTQAVTADGLLLESQVELLPESDTVTVARGEEGWVSASYREKGYVGDGLVADVRVSGPEGLVEIPLQRPPTTVEALWDSVAAAAEDAPWAAPFIALPLAIATPFLIIVDFLASLSCAFDTCPEDYPFPSWMDAGAVGVFFVKVKGEVLAGTYPITITFEGQNYDAATLAFDVVVE